MGFDIKITFKLGYYYLDYMVVVKNNGMNLEQNSLKLI